MSNIMTKSLLSYIYKTVTRRANMMQYNENLPSISQMKSLNIPNPTSEEIYNDYGLLSRHFHHPIYINFIPTYDESKKCIKTAWLKRYLETRTL
tara:strand:- start:3006 stop:3287 length:282 start_codon:yes stop_codon:yes gene_type:complete